MNSAVFAHLLEGFLKNRAGNQSYFFNAVSVANKKISIHYPAPCLFHVMDCSGESINSILSSILMMTRFFSRGSIASYMMNLIIVRDEKEQVRRNRVALKYKLFSGRPVIRSRFGVICYG